MISANEAREIVKRVKSYYHSSKYPWDILNKKIKEASKNQKNYFYYSDYQYPKFYESSEEVKQKLKKLGYNVQIFKQPFVIGNKIYTETTYEIKW